MVEKRDKKRKIIKKDSFEEKERKLADEFEKALSGLSLLL